MVQGFAPVFRQKGASEMPKILFLESRNEFEAGKVYKLVIDSANHWLARNVATRDPELIAKAEADALAAVEAAEKTAQEQKRVADEEAAKEAVAAEERRVAAERAANEEAQRRIDAKGSASSDAKLDIPADWRSLQYPKMRGLAALLTNEPVNSKERAVAVIETELAARAEMAKLSGDAAAPAGADSQAGDGQ